MRSLSLFSCNERFRRDTLHTSFSAANQLSNTSSGTSSIYEIFRSCYPTNPDPDRFLQLGIAKLLCAIICPKLPAFHTAASLCKTISTTTSRKLAVPTTLDFNFVIPYFATVAIRQRMSDYLGDYFAKLVIFSPELSFSSLGRTSAGKVHIPQRPCKLAAAYLQIL